MSKGRTASIVFWMFDKLLSPTNFSLSSLEATTTN